MSRRWAGRGRVEEVVGMGESEAERGCQGGGSRAMQSRWFGPTPRVRWAEACGDSERGPLSAVHLWPQVARDAPTISSYWVRRVHLFQPVSTESKPSC